MIAGMIERRMLHPPTSSLTVGGGDGVDWKVWFD
jgi:hypothetical protein